MFCTRVLTTSCTTTSTTQLERDCLDVPMGAPSLQRISALMKRQAFRHMSIRLALHAQLDDPDEQRLLKQHVVSIVLDGFGFYTSGPLIAERHMQYRDCQASRCTEASQKILGMVQVKQEPQSHWSGFPLRTIQTASPTGRRCFITVYQTAHAGTLHATVMPSYTCVT